MFTRKSSRAHLALAALVKCSCANRTLVHLTFPRGPPCRSGVALPHYAVSSRQSLTPMCSSMAQGPPGIFVCALLYLLCTSMTPAQYPSQPHVCARVSCAHSHLHEHLFTGQVSDNKAIFGAAPLCPRRQRTHARRPWKYLDDGAVGVDLERLLGAPA